MINTTLCYLEKDGCYLMLHRIKKEGDLNRDKWIGVGGKFEAGESPEECAYREVLEETGLELKSHRYRGIVTFVSDQWGTQYMHLFWSDDFSGTVRQCDEGVLEWVDKGRLGQLELWQGDYLFLNLLATNRPFFSLKLQYVGENLIRAILDGERVG